MRDQSAKSSIRRVSGETNAGQLGSGGIGGEDTGQSVLGKKTTTNAKAGRGST